MPGPPLYLYRPLPFHTVGADSISARAPSPLRPTNPRVALLYSLYVRAVRGTSSALKTARRAVFAPRYADAGPGLFDSRTPLLLTMYNKKKKAQPLAKLSFLVTRAGIEFNLDTLHHSFSTFQRAVKFSTLSITRLNGFYCGVKLLYFPHFPSLL